MFFCDCEEELATRFLPYQLKFGTEYGTGKRFPVIGSTSKMCQTCKGEKEEPHPMVYGSKLERYYWREIFKTYLSLVAHWLDSNNLTVTNILAFESQYAKQSDLLKKEAKTYWQDRHNQSPKYTFAVEPTEADFLSEVKVPERNLTGRITSVKKGKKNAKAWINSLGKECSVEDIASEWFSSNGFIVKKCELRLVSVLVATFCFPVIIGQERSIGSLLTRGFGSEQFFASHKQEFEKNRHYLEKAENLAAIYNNILPESHGLRLYLGVEDAESVELGLLAIKAMPRSMLLDCVQFGFESFWARRAGWPDLFAARLASNEFLFAEVKGSTDKLSLQQMDWFKWAIQKAKLPCEIVRVNATEENKRQV